MEQTTVQPPCTTQVRTDTAEYAQQKRLPSLDGWRALSIFMVLADHTRWYAQGFPKSLFPASFWLVDGDLGVRFFFAISGFLITRLLLQEWNSTQTINLTHFYIRRCLRILPVYFVFLLTVYILAQSTGSPLNSRSWGGCLTFTRNVFGIDGISSHLWSLSIEEQFYLLWPTTLLLLLAKRNLRILLGTTLFIILLAAMFRGTANMNILPEYYPTLHLPESLITKLGFLAVIIAIRFFSYADSLAIGCLAAILLAHKGAEVRAKLTTQPRLVAGIASACILIPHLLNHLLPAPPTFCEQFGNSFQAVGFSALLLQSILLPEFAIYRLLNWKPVVQIGILSYSLYIWQQLFWSAPKGLGLDNIWWCGFWIPPLFLIAALSYYGLERPLMKLRTAFRPKTAE
jgi:peptidoglycan/LPS O-acetylase OafA/YrhL